MLELQADPRVARLARLGRQRDFPLARFRKALLSAVHEPERREALRHLFAEWTGLSLSPEEASQLWTEVERSLPLFRRSLGRPLGLQTVLLHHLHSRAGRLKEPRIVSGPDLAVLRVSALTDPLTGLYNRRFLLDHLAREMARAERADGILSIALMDLKGFKAVNDRFGHPVGDSVLVRTARVIRDSLRSVDAGCRWGGDEFVLVLPSTSLLFALAVAERVRRRVAALALQVRSELKLDLHYGAATYPTDGRTPEFLLKVADLRLYQCRAHSSFAGAERRSHPRFAAEKMSVLLRPEGADARTVPVVDVSHGGVGLRLPGEEAWPRRSKAEIARRQESERHAIKLRPRHFVPLPDGTVRVGCSYV